jgi:hypothetical protein
LRACGERRSDHKETSTVLRDETDITIRTTPTERTASLTRAADTSPALAALIEARECLAYTLDLNDLWRALNQLEAREQAGEWLDVIESDVLRERLTQALAADSNFMAVQFIDAAIASLDANERAQRASTSTVVMPAALLPEPEHNAAPLTYAAELATVPAVPRLPPPLPAFSGRAPTANPARPPLAQNRQASLPPVRALALRIPTLVPHDLRTPEQHVPLEPVPPTAPSSPLDDEARFDQHAIGIEEADVQIVKRTASKPAILNTKLPPLPLVDRPATPPVRMGRAPVAKWADNDAGEPDDYRPIGSALDEAQVTIIATGEHEETRARAERRALGIATDREAQMKRFLKALSGE